MHHDIVYELFMYAREHGLKLTYDFDESVYEYKFIFKDTDTETVYIVTVDRRKLELFGGSKAQLVRRIIYELEGLIGRRLNNV